MTTEKILIVEDETVSSRSLELRMKKLGYEVLPAATTGEEALAMVENAPPDLILMDIRLRGEMDGIELAEIIRARWDIPIVYLTAHSEDETVQRATATTPFGYLLKPIDPTELRITIEMALYKHKMESKLRANEEQLRLITESMNDTVWLMDTNFKTIYISPSVVRTRGFTLEELQAMTLDQHLTPPALDLVMTLMSDELIQERRLEKEREIVLQVELEFYCKDGSTLWSDNTFTIIRDARGIPAQILGVGRDVTEQRQHRREQELIAALAQALRGAETREETLNAILEQVQQFLQASGAGIILQQPETGVLVVETAIGEVADMKGYRIPRQSGIAYHAIQAGKAVVADDFQTDAKILDDICRRSKNGAWTISVPLIVHNQTLGAINVILRNRVQEQDIRLLETIATFAAETIQRADFQAQTQKQLQRLEVLHTIDRAITAITDVGMLLSIFTEQLLRVFAFDAAVVWLYRPGTNMLNLANSRGLRQPPPLNATQRLGRGIAGQVALERRQMIIHNLTRRVADFEGSPIKVGEEGYSMYIGAPLIARGELKGILELYHRQPVTPDADNLEFLDGIARQAAIAIDNATLFVDLQRTNSELLQAYNATLESLAQIADNRDERFMGHSQKVADLGMQIGRAMDLEPERLVQLYRGALMHDLGTLTIPEAILAKPGELDDAEWVVVKRHPELAYEWFAGLEFVKPALDIPYCHHERWDGSGYPRGLLGEEIPLLGRIVAVADVWDALIHDRPWRKAWSRAIARDYIRQGAGTQFDPRVVAVFLSLVG